MEITMKECKIFCTDVSILQKSNLVNWVTVLYFKFIVELLKNCLYFIALPSTHTPPPSQQVHSDAIPLSIIEYEEHGEGGGAILRPGHPSSSNGALSPYPVQNPRSVPACIYVGVNSSSIKQLNVTSLQLNSSCYLLRQNDSNICKNIYLAYDETIYGIYQNFC